MKNYVPSPETESQAVNSIVKYYSSYNAYTHEQLLLSDLNHYCMFTVMNTCMPYLQSDYCKHLNHYCQITVRLYSSDNLKGGGKEGRKAQ